MSENNKTDYKALTPAGGSRLAKTSFKKPLATWLAENVSGMEKLLAVQPRCIWTYGEGDHPDNPPACYRNGKRHGLWEEREMCDRVVTCTYVDGMRNGHLESRFPSGNGETGPVVNG